MGWSKFRGKQIRNWVYQKLIADPAKMTNLSKVDQARLADEFRFAEASILSHRRQQRRNAETSARLARPFRGRMRNHSRRPPAHRLHQFAGGLSRRV